MLRFISSVRLAIILIAAIAGLSVSATIYDMPEMFRNWPFRVVVGIFFVNLLTCTVKLWPGLLRTVRTKSRDFVGKELTFKPSRCDEESVYEYLRREHYQIDEYCDRERKYIFAKKGMLSLLAPHLLHIGILVIIVGAMLSSFSVKNQIQLVPGETSVLPQNIIEHTGPVSIHVKDFKTVYDRQGTVENWITNFYLDGEPFNIDAETKVNHPFKAHGLSIYQMAYANRYEVDLKGSREDLNGTYLFPEDQRVPLKEGSMMFSAMGENTVLFQLFDKDGKLLRQEGLRKGDGIHLPDNTRITYQKMIASTVLELKYGHAIPIVFAGFILSAIACCCFWFGRYRSIAILIEKQQVSCRIRSKSGSIRKEIECALAMNPESEDFND